MTEFARFASRYGKFSHGVPDQIWVEEAGEWRTLGRALQAEFEPGGLTEYEKEEALKSFKFQGLPEDRETGMPVSPISRLSCFDSKLAMQQNRWERAEHDLVVKTLRESSQLGFDFIELSTPKRPAPWNGYDEMNGPEEIAALTKATKSPVADVIAYEKDNQAREDVITALEDLLGEDVEQEIVIQA